MEALESKPKPILVVLAFSAVCVIWGTTYYAILIGLKAGMPPFLMGTFRFILASILMLGYCKWRGELSFKSAFIIRNLLIGSVLLTGGQGILFWAENYISSGYAAILVATLPLWYVVLDNKNRTVYLSNKGIVVGLLLGFASILLLFLKELSGFSNLSSKSFLLGASGVLFSCICWVSASLYHTNYNKNASLFNGLSWQLVGGAISCFLVSLVMGEPFHTDLATIPVIGWWAIIYLAVAGSFCAFMAYQWLLRVKPPAVVCTYAYVNPVIAVILGYWAASEEITYYQVMGMLGILLGAYLVNRSKLKMNKEKVNPKVAK